MSAFAAGKYAFGYCDRCGLRYDIKDLKHEVTNRVRTGLLVCIECLDKDHPQYRVGLIKTDDPQSLRDPRPDTSQATSRKLSSWNPVGAEASGLITISVGRVTVSTS